MKKSGRICLALFLSWNLILASPAASSSPTAQEEATKSANEATQSSQLGQVESEATKSAKAESEVESLTTSFNLDPSGKFVSDELFVKFKEGITEVLEQKILGTHGVKIKKRYDKYKVLLIKVEPKSQDALKRALEQNPLVEYVQLNGVGRIQEGGGSVTKPNDLYYQARIQWGLDKIFAPIGWNLYKGSSSIKVAILDTGVDYNHWDLQDNSIPVPTRIILGRDYINGDNNPFDDNGHGTKVAGIVGALTNNDLGMAAVDWYAKIVAIKVADSSGFWFDSTLADGIEEAVFDHGAKVINMSLALGTRNAFVQEVIRIAHDINGVTFVAAVLSNTSTRNCFMTYPAAYDNVISVGASNRSDSWYAGCTSNIDPADNKAHNVYSVIAPGNEILSINLSGASEPASYFSGTSFAAPFVSGIASILYSIPGCTQPNVEGSIRFGSQDLGPASWDSTFGYGRVDLFKAIDFICY